MELKHYVKYYWSFCANTYSKVEEIASRDVSKLPLGDMSIGDNVYALEIFDRIVGELDYEGKTYPVKTDKLNNELYYVGYFYSLKDIKALRGNSVYEEFINRGWAGEIACQVATSKVVPKEELDELLKVLGLENRRKHLPNELSGGQQQRVAIGRALINHPAIVLADEPTGNLDSNSSDEIVQLLKTSNKKYNQTIIMITHNPEIAKVADRIIRIEDGKIVENK